ncbi:DUF6585 family protein [Dictyobacter aurantiacus]|uniref:Uncharacterized protein n=1 Tax=Dictyobacter aurantiacus TaxID=1936993 RepID=A0A401ZQW6_9CHLR|nr:DUF6585 family protein [Dictyobacter aurantiacus]GCE09200.1 hypothetical protein KDAU_65290 [Dictyobacter aurantiacus]
MHVPVEVTQQASIHHLGIPQKRYTRFWQTLPYLFVAIITLLLSVSLFILAILTGPIPVISEVPDWKGFGILTTVGILIGATSALYLYLSIPPLAFAAYVYSEGFIECNRWTHSIIHTLRWSQVEGTHINRSRYGTTYSIYAFTASPPNNVFTIPYRGIWKRCKQATTGHEARRKKEEMPLTILMPCTQSTNSRMHTP